jgi:hypothetical protein
MLTKQCPLCENSCLVKVRDVTDTVDCTNCGCKKDTVASTQNKIDDCTHFKAKKEIWVWERGIKYKTTSF